MKKRILNIFSAVICMVLLSFESITAFAGNVNTIEATQSNGVITVTGTVGSDVLACAILVYDATGSNLISMETCGVSDSQTFSHTFSTALSSGNYLVKVADYNGGNYAEDTIAIATTSITPTTPTSPTTTSPTTSSPTATTSTVETQKVATPVEYTVVRGDNLYKIAKINGLSLSKLLALNPSIKNPNLIFAGQKIVVGFTYTDETVTTDEDSSVTEYYTVKSGDFLIKIARLHKMTLADLVKLNPDIMRQKYIFPGQLIRVK